MEKNFSPLDADTRYKNLVYCSEAKLKQMLLDADERGFVFTLPFAMGGGGVNSHRRGTRDLLNSAASLIERNRMLSYEASPRVGHWLLVRAIASCGTAWPWNGDREEFHETAWWVGRSERLRILAYGHRDHLLGMGKVPASQGENGRATWWPSVVGGFQELLASVAVVVIGDDLNSSVDLRSRADFGETFRGLDRYFFDEGVRRDSPLIQEGVYEMLLRVDGVEDGDGDEPHVVYGSPLWVAKVNDVVPGTYSVSNDADQPGIAIVASWNGLEWSDLRMQDYRDPLMRYQRPRSVLPELPTEPPDLDDLMSLAIRAAPTDEQNGQPTAEVDPSKRKFFARMRGRWQRN
ncbi:hypothetical protein [Sanguibacter sp. 25GB23B1]|uniref:hypothetical protein n=1 Tax=unclassified Sanguibacter TaxID=2645534 RepID=UPI0032B00C0D